MIRKCASHATENVVFSTASLSWKHWGQEFSGTFITSVFPEMMCISCFYPTITVPKTATAFCKVDILGILSSIRNETTDPSLVLTINPGKSSPSGKLPLGLVPGRREGWICASAWLIHFTCWKICVFLRSAWWLLEAGLCYLLWSVPQSTADFRKQQNIYY